MIIPNVFITVIILFERHYLISINALLINPGL